MQSSTYDYFFISDMLLNMFRPLCFREVIAAQDRVLLMLLRFSTLFPVSLLFIVCDLSDIPRNGNRFRLVSLNWVGQRDLGMGMSCCVWCKFRQAGMYAGV